MFGVIRNAAFAKVLLVGVLVLAGATAGQAVLSTDGSVKFTGGVHNNILAEHKGFPETWHGDDGEAFVPSARAPARRATVSIPVPRTDCPCASRRFLRPVPRAPPLIHFLQR